MGSGPSSPKRNVGRLGQTRMAQSRENFPSQKKIGIFLLGIFRLLEQPVLAVNSMG